jgi:hypothetical protein
MRTDTYTKVMLTIIALMLTLIACKTVVSPDKSASAEGPAAGLQLLTKPGALVFFDNRTSEVWFYYDDFSSTEGGKLEGTWKLTKLGEPLVRENYKGKVY